MDQQAFMAPFHPEPPVIPKMEEDVLPGWPSYTADSHIQRPDLFPYGGPSSPEPTHVQSDLLEQMASHHETRVAGLASHPRILAAQKEWEQNQQFQNLAQSTADVRYAVTGSQPTVQPFGEQPRGQTGSGASLANNMPADAADHPMLSSSYQSLKRAALSGRNSPAIPNAKRVQTSSRSPASHEQSRSSTDVEDKKRKALGLTEAETSKKMFELQGQSTDTRPQAALPTASVLSQQATSSSVKASVMNGPQPQTVAPPKDGDSLVALVHATDGRSYNMFPTRSGENISGCGALIPANYKPHSQQGLEFICPVRDCRRLFPGIKALGGHFRACHNSATFNDNGDGTLSKVGSYVKQVPGRSPGIIISQNPLRSDAPPPIEPSLPPLPAQYALKRKVGTVEGSAEGSTAKPTITPVPIPKPMLTRASTSRTGALSDVKEYLHSHLHPGQPVFKREDIDFMLTLPRQRDLPFSWIHCHQGSSLGIIVYSCALAYLTGREVSGSSMCSAFPSKLGKKAKRMKTLRLSEPCIALPSSMPYSAKRLFSSTNTCVGCRYWSYLQRQANQCDWGSKPERRSSASSASTVATKDSAASSNSTQSESVDESTADGDVPARRQRTNGPSVSGKGRTPVTATAKATSVKPAAKSSTNYATEELEMEDWEFAPGRRQDATTSEGIAYSNAYLSGGQPVTIMEDISVNVVTVKPGGYFHWSPENDKLRSCTVGSGKVRVTLGDNEEFHLGPNGLFIIRPGQSCRVDNRVYQDAAVHCTTVADYSLR